MVKTSLSDKTYAPGTHVLLDFFGAQNLSSISHIEQALHQAADACDATVLDIKLHSFGDHCGVTGVVLLAESHISIHTWPETGFVALDVFMCGACDAKQAIAPLIAAFKPMKTSIQEVTRGIDE